MKTVHASNKQACSCWQDKAFSLSHCWLKPLSNSAYICYRCYVAPSILREMPVKSKFSAYSVNLMDILFPWPNAWIIPATSIQAEREEYLCFKSHHGQLPEWRRHFFLCVCLCIYPNSMLFLQPHKNNVSQYYPKKIIIKLC